MILFALPERHARRIRELIGRLQPGTKGPGSNHSLDAVSMVPGWWLQKVDGTQRVMADRDAGRTVRVWTVVKPEDRDPSVPWAVPPFKRFFTRPELIEFLKDEWVPDAAKLLQEDAAALAEVEAAAEKPKDKED